MPVGTDCQRPRHHRFTQLRIRRQALPRTASAQNAPTVATNAQCGQHVTASLTLNGDLTCTSGTALIVTGSNVVLNVNGHQLIGSGPTTGIELDGTSNTIENGLVSGFTVAIYIAGTSDTILNVRAVSNSYGIEDVGTATKITNSVASRSANYGIFTSGSGGFTGRPRGGQRQRRRHPHLIPRDHDHRQHRKRQWSRRRSR